MSAEPQPQISAPGGDRWVVFVSDIPLAPDDHGNRVRARQMVEAIRRAGFKVAYILWERYPCCSPQLIKRMVTLCDDLFVVPFRQDRPHAANLSMREMPMEGLARRFTPRQIGRVLLHRSARLAAKMLRLLPVGNRLIAAVKWHLVEEANPADWYPDNLRTALELMLATRPVVAVIAEYLYLSQALVAVQRCGVMGIVDTHDVFHLRRERMQKLGLDPDWFIVDRDVESQLLSLADHVIAIQQEEAGLLRELVPPEKVVVVEHAVPQRPLPEKPADQNRRVAIVGSDNPLNQDGLQWFLSAVWPLVLQRVPDADLYVYGRLSEQDFCSGPRVKACGFVDDLASAYAEASVVVNPVRGGTGLKIKTVEALAYGKPTITTSIGAEGIQDAIGHALVTADRPPDLANAICRVLLDGKEAQALATRAYRYAQGRFGLERTYAPLVRLLESREPVWALAAPGDDVARPAPPTPSLRPLWLRLWQEVEEASEYAAVRTAISAQIAALESKRIEFWLDSHLVGDTEQHLIRVAAGLRALGFECRLRVPETSDLLLNEIEKHDLEVDALESANMGLADSCAVVHVFPTHIMGMMEYQEILLGATVPWFTSYQFTFTRKPFYVADEVAARLQWQWTHCAGVGFVSEFDRRLVAAIIGLDYISQHVIRNGAAGAGETGDSLGAAGSGDMPTLLWFGRHSPTARVDVLVESLRRAIEAGLRTPLRLLLVCSRALEDRVTTELMRCGLLQQIQVRHCLHQVDACVRAADAVLVTSDFEAMPPVLVQALQASKPVVSTAIGGLVDILRPGEDAVLCAPGDIGAVAAGIRSVLDDAAEAARLGHHAHARAATHLNIEETVLKFALLYLDHLAPDAAELSPEQAPTPAPRLQLRQDPVFVVGFPRSGTTLVQSMLAALPGVVSFPETHFFDLILPKIFEYTANKADRRPLQAATAIARDKLSLTQAAAASLTALVEGDAFSEKDVFEILVRDCISRQSIPEDQACTLRWLEKTPDHALHLNKIRSLYPDATFICVLRNPLQAIASIRRVTVEWGNERWLPVEEYCLRWLATMDAAEQFRRHNPERFCFVRLEDLCADPQAHLQELCTVADLAYDAQAVNDYRAVARELILPHENWKSEVMDAEISAEIARRPIANLSKLEIARINNCLKNRAALYGYRLESPSNADLEADLDTEEILESFRYLFNRRKLAGLREASGLPAPEPNPDAADPPEQ